MNFGVLRVPTPDVRISTPRFAADLVRMIEDQGCESLWCVEHVLIPDSYESRYPFDPSGKMGLDGMADLPDMLIWLSFAASVTTTLKLGTGILVLPMRNPVVLAKQLATLHELSEGRMMLGVGAGWLEEEFDAVGESFHDRGRRMDEYIDVLRCLWRDAPATFHGDFVNFENCYSCPQPGERGIPILVGGTGRTAISRAVKRGDGLYFVAEDTNHLRTILKMLDEEAALVGRDPREIEITCPGPATVDQAREFQELGVSRFVLPLWQGTIAECREAIQGYQDGILAHLT